jgi:urea carboxylase
MWNRFRPFDGDKPWLLRFFDQIRFYPVSESELLAFRDAFPRGRAKLSIEPTTFRLADYQSFLNENRDSIVAFKQRQQAAFEAERERWALLPAVEEVEPEVETSATELSIGEGQLAVRSQVAGSVWHVAVKDGDRVEAGDKLVVLETMKMETVVVAPEAGVVVAVVCKQGMLANAGTPLIVLNRIDRQA